MCEFCISEYLSLHRRKVHGWLNFVHNDNDYDKCADKVKVLYCHLLMLFFFASFPLCNVDVIGKVSQEMLAKLLHILCPRPLGILKHDIGVLLDILKLISLYDVGAATQW